MADKSTTQPSYTLLPWTGYVAHSTTLKLHLDITTNDTTNITNECHDTVHDITFDKSVRLSILYLTIAIGVVGFLLVISWMVCNRRLTPRINHMSRVNTLILNLTIADILVILVAVLPQLIWEYVDRAWTAGPVMCRLVKFMQSFSMMASNYMLVVIAIDRHQAIMSPLKESLTIWRFAGAGWAMAMLLSTPVLALFHLNDVNGTVHCENIFRDKPIWHRQIWTTYVVAVVFIIPLVILALCYTRIFLKIAKKATQSSSKNKARSFKDGEVHLQSTHSSSLPKAKVKTLKMTFVIILTYMICSLPYIIVETIMSYGDHCIIPKALYALFGGMAACNSATNPFVFLIFNANIKWFKDVKQCSQRGYSPSRGCMYSPANSSVTSRFAMHHNNHGSVLEKPSQAIRLESMSTVE